jgi:FkbM family methyltransferase
VTLKPIRDPVVELRSGLRIHLSGHPHDVITVFLIFVREDYGQVHFGSTLVDVGANIGVFSLYAASRKAGRVYAYEPNTQTYACLMRNITDNHLEQTIHPYQFAVSSSAGDTVKFPVQPSVYNAIITGDTAAEFERVMTTSLPAILDEHHLDRVDLLKLDCEGAEYDIVFDAPDEMWARIDRIRLEYHNGRVDELRSHLEARGYRLASFRKDLESSGNLWFEKA